MPRGGIGRADLLRVLVKQGGELSPSAIEALGFSVAPKSIPQENNKPAAAPQDRQTQAASTDLFDQALPLTRVPFWQPVSVEFDEINHPDPSVDTHKATCPQRAPEPPPNYRYLAPFTELVPRLRAAFSERRLSQAYDIPCLVDQVGRGNILRHFPRRRWMGWGSNLYVIEDRSDRLAPYVRDQAMVQNHLQQLYVKADFFSAIYSELTALPLVHWPNAPPAAIEPQAGDQILVLGDLGVLAEDGGEARSFWSNFGQRLRQVGASAIALLPCSPRECPFEIAAHYQLLSWEHPAPPPCSKEALETQGQHLITQLAIAGRIEPGLLREIRIGLGSEHYPVRLEAWVWQHPAMDAPDMVATSFKSELAPQFRRCFVADTAHREQSLSTVKSWLRHLPYEIWLETVIEMLDGNWRSEAIDSREVSDAKQLLSYLVGYVSTQRGDALSPQGLGWIEGLVTRLGRRVKNSAVSDACWVLSEALKNRQAGLPPAKTRSMQRYQLHQLGGQLRFQPQTNQPTQQGTPIALIDARGGRLEITPEEFLSWADNKPPSWASDCGEDDCGLWVEFTYKGVCQRMRWIAPGRFLMGSPQDEHGRSDNEGPQHTVRLTQGYWLFDTAVTQALWQAVVGENPSCSRGEDLPVEQVSWSACQRFIKKLNTAMPGLALSLPSEAQWEYACRAGTTTPFSLGEDIDPEEVNYDGNSPYLEGGKKGEYRGKTLSVTAFLANLWGLYQMHGNVWEWCLDSKRQYGEMVVSDPLGSIKAGAERVIRGGSRLYGARFCRSACRNWYSPYNRLGIIGFRCARVQMSPAGVAQPAAPAELADHLARRGEAVALHLPLGQQTVLHAISRADKLHLKTDRGIFTLHQRHIPQWASAIGRDRFGLWSKFTLEVDQGEAITQRMRWIPPGRFLMGSPEDEPGRYSNEGPLHEVTITEGYWLFDAPVTQALWQAVMSENPSVFNSPQRPVETISWQQAKKFIIQLNALKRGLALSLPSEAQWEYACRAGSNTALHTGDIVIEGERNAPALDDIAWYGGNSGEGFDLDGGYDSSDWPEKQYQHMKAGTRPVKLKNANLWGLHDMLGNVWEWCEDDNRDYKATSETDPQGTKEVGAERVIRGGSWFSRARLCRSARRDWFSPGDRNDGIGFRCARVQA